MPRSGFPSFGINVNSEIIHEPGEKPRVVAAQYLAKPFHTVKGDKICWVLLLPFEQTPSDFLIEKRIPVIQQLNDLPHSLWRKARIKYLNDLILRFRVVSDPFPGHQPRAQPFSLSHLPILFSSYILEIPQS